MDVIPAELGDKPFQFACNKILTDVIISVNMLNHVTFGRHNQYPCHHLSRFTPKPL